LRFKVLNLTDAVIFCVSCLSAFFDLRVRRIPNWLIAIGLICGVILNAFQGSHYLVQSLLGIVVGIAVLILPFALGWIGAGDVKYFGVVGALLGVSWLPRVFFYSALIAGLIAFGYLSMGLASISRFKEFWLDFKAVVLSMGNVLPDPVRTKTGGRSNSVPWGVAFAAGTLVAYYVDPSGRWAGF
jgi:prepilin peptidase CpaA